MAYITPSVLVYQQLEEAGGVQNSTPELEAAIVGPLYNVVYAKAGDSDSLNNSQAYTIDDWDAEETAIKNENGSATGFTIPLPDTKPGQEPLESSVKVPMTETEVLVNVFEVDIDFTGGTVDTSLIPTTTSPSAGSNNPAFPFDQELPDGTDNHANVGDKVIITYDDNGTQTIETYVSEVVDSNTIRVAHPLPSVTGTIATGKIYHLYNYFEVDSSFIDTTNLASQEVELSFTANPYPGTSIPADSGLMSGFAFLSGTVHVQYRALRTDQSSTLLTINDNNDLESKLGVANDDNPLALACQIALANTTTPVRAMSIESDDLAGYTGALQVLEGEDRVYYLVPLTQDESIIQAFVNHVEQLSVPEEGIWRVVIANTEIPSQLFLIGTDSNSVTTGSFVADANNSRALFRDSSNDFITQEVTPGDTITITASSDANVVDNTYTVEKVLDADTIELRDTADTDITDSATAEYYISRELTNRQQAENVAATAETFGSKRVWHIMPDQVGVNVDGATKYLPGYYLCAGHAGMGAGFPVQQGFTNIGVAGITDLRHSNFYFSRESLAIMAEKGVCLYVQATQGGLPYCRHALTTDVSVLEYREQLKVKNWDFLSYYYKDKLKPFIGNWNITPDTLANMRQTVIASSELLTSRSLPKIGPPLLSYDLRKLEQDPNNIDQVNVELGVEIVSPNNYTNVYLII